ncbi:zinc dependent phospholipase C family protein [Paracidovorax valerianellae]|uniref:Zinc dependent phospholipase C n=1 Tax=Paracidovorax valerianellae TaxID=187868 RepID=A0A1G6YYJ1_9BURK|nr:zinc dependent phospholipase C family protein [Paracidovorax valerianellae]MDA8447320.1 zinc dependent phospholipase C family protein [Paracidovorax valerianellae]SDD94705.1 Zinc dependent phospholipase C [Paracidovorax valerianellae]
MPGAYAHITAVNVAKAKARGVLSNESMLALGTKFQFAELGAVSPDYPYLGFGQGVWADQMHYKNTAALLRSGVEGVRKLTGSERQKALSWLLGVACHMTADMTIHPIVEGIVGPYEQNKAAHRTCEMHQDAFIFPELKVGEVGLTKHLNTGIGSCGAPGNALALDPTIKRLWLQMLKQSYPAAVAEVAVEPDPDKWHSGFCTILKTLRGATALFPFARHVAANEGLLYPAPEQVSLEYVKNLKTPEGSMGYKVLFDRAVENIIIVWQGIEAAVEGRSTFFIDNLENWNLDTGKAQSTGKYVFWRN